MTAQSPAHTRSAVAAPALLRETIGSIAVLTLNRPQARNSLSEAMLAALSQELESLARDERIRAVVLARNVPRKQAMEMLLTGDMISAEDAYRIGLVNRVVEPGRAREEALELARKIGAKSAAVVKLGKEAFYQQLNMNIADAYAYASEIMVKNMMARDAGEGISAFVEKRQPRWEDR